MTWDPRRYPSTIRAELHDYDELQDEVARATLGVTARWILHLGTGQGETASRVLQLHEDARLVGIDSSAKMLAAAAERLPAARVLLVQQDLSAPLPDGSFDLVISGLAIHHLDRKARSKLFADVAGHLREGGRFVVGDVIVPDDPTEAVIEIEPGYDFPSRADEQLSWMADAGLQGEIVWRNKDLAVFRAEVSRRSRPQD